MLRLVHCRHRGVGTQFEHPPEVQRRQAEMGARRLRMAGTIRQLELRLPALQMEFDLVRHRYPDSLRFAASMIPSGAARIQTDQSALRARRRQG